MIQNEQFKELFEKQTKLIEDLSSQLKETQKSLKEKKQKKKIPGTKYRFFSVFCLLS